MNQDCISRAELRKRVIESRDKLKAQGNLPLPSGYAACLELIDEAPTLTADDYFDAVDRIKPCPNCRYTLLGALTEDVPRWIPVTERLPEDVYGKGREQIVVLVCTKSGKVSQCARMADYECIADETLTKVEWIKNGKFYWSKNKAVTHWMPLPSMEGLDG